MTNTFALKAEIRDLIARCGGVERAALVCGLSKSSVQRWGSPNHDDLPPLRAVIALQRDGQSLALTDFLARESGVEPVEARDVAGEFANAVRSMGAVTASYAEAVADGQITPAEARAICAELIAARDGLDKLHLAVGQAGGGLV